MHTVCLETIHASFLVVTNRCLSWGVSPNEQVWTGFQWSPPDVTSRGFPGLMSRGTLPDLSWSGRGYPTSPVQMEYPTIWAILWSIWCYPPWTDKRLWKHYLPANVFAGGNEWHNRSALYLLYSRLTLKWHQHISLNYIPLRAFAESCGTLLPTLQFRDLGCGMSLQILLKARGVCSNLVSSWGVWQKRLKK